MTVRVRQLPPSVAETYVYSLDANGDGQITLNDRTAAQTGSFNPAADTENPLDFAIFRRVYGYDGTAQVVQLAPMTPYLFTNAVAGIKYNDGVVPEPLFSYIMTEDVNNDGVLDDTECVNDVVDTCPPVTNRAPLLYVWGDTNFDEELSGAERAALLTLPVGSPDWSKNPLATGGILKKTQLAVGFNPGTGTSLLEVTDASQLTVGSYVTLGTGFVTETVTVLAVRVKAGNDLVSLSSVPTLVHAAGTDLEVSPDSLLRAVQGIQINFTAISPKKDRDNGHAPVGRTGRKTQHDMDYRTLTLQRTVHLVNHSTVPLAGSASGASYIPPAAHCPLTMVTGMRRHEPESVLFGWRLSSPGDLQGHDLQQPECRGGARLPDADRPRSGLAGHHRCPGRLLWAGLSGVYP